MSATLLLISLPFVFLLGLLVAGVGARMHFIRTEQTFRCKVRFPDYPPSLLRWPRHRVRAAWVHDVLVIQSGLLRPRTVVLAVVGPDRAAAPGRADVAGLGTDPVMLALRLDDRSTVDVAARDADRAALAGPFLAALIPGLPPAPTEPRPRTN